jgi:hypothetical protein
MANSYVNQTAGLKFTNLYKRIVPSGIGQREESRTAQKPSRNEHRSNHYAIHLHKNKMPHTCWETALEDTARYTDVIISIYRFAPISSSHHCNKTI